MTGLWGIKAFCGNDLVPMVYGWKNRVPVWRLKSEGHPVFSIFESFSFLTCRDLLWRSTTIDRVMDFMQIAAWGYDDPGAGDGWQGDKKYQIISWKLKIQQYQGSNGQGVGVVK